MPILSFIWSIFLPIPSFICSGMLLLPLLPLPLLLEDILEDGCDDEELLLLLSLSPELFLEGLFEPLELLEMPGSSKP